MTEQLKEVPSMWFAGAILTIDQHKLTEAATSWELALAQGRQLPCESVLEEQWWANKLTAVQAVLTAMEAEREELVRPLIDDKRKVDAAYKTATAPAQAFKELAKSKLAEAEGRRLQAQEAARQLAANAAAVGDTAACTAALAAIPEDAEVKGRSTSTVWVPRVVDASLVPDIYKVVDEKALKAVAKAFAKKSEPPTIPGVVFEREVQVRVFTGKKKP